MKTPCFSPRIPLATLLLFATGAGRLCGQIKEFTTDLELRHRDAKGKIDVRFRDREEKGHDITKPIRVYARTNEQINIVVKDANTLLFKYTAGAQTEVDAQGVAALDALNKLIGADLKSMATSTGSPAGAGVRPMSVEVAPPVMISAGGIELDYDELVVALDRFTKLVAGIPAKTDETLRGAPDENYPTPEQVSALEMISKLLSMLEHIENKGLDLLTPVVQVQPSVGKGASLTANEVAHLETLLQEQAAAAPASQPLAQPEVKTSDSIPTEMQIVAEAAGEVVKIKARELKELAIPLQLAKVNMETAEKLEEAAQALERAARSDGTSAAEQQRLRDRVTEVQEKARNMVEPYKVVKVKYDEGALALSVAQGSYEKATKNIAVRGGAAPAKPISVPNPSNPVNLANPSIVKAKRLVGAAFAFRAKLLSTYTLATNFRKHYAEYRTVYKTGKIIARVPAKIDKDITQPVVIEKAGMAYSKSAGVTAQQTDFIGTTHVEVAAHQSFHLGAGVGPIYSFVKNPDFSVATDAAGTMTIAQKTSESQALSAALTFNFYPDRYFGEAVEPFIQIGYSPLKDVQGILVGGGARLFGNTQFSGGVIYQQRRVLKSGLSVGSVLTKAEDLVVEKEFKPGVYIQVSVPLPYTK